MMIRRLRSKHKSYVTSDFMNSPSAIQTNFFYFLSGLRFVHCYSPLSTLRKIPRLSAKTLNFSLLSFNSLSKFHLFPLPLLENLGSGEKPKARFLSFRSDLPLSSPLRSDPPKLAQISLISFNPHLLADRSFGQAR